MTKNKGVPGNTIAEQVLTDRIMLRAGIDMHRLEHAATKGISDWGTLVSIRVRAPNEKSSEWLVVLTVEAENSRVVAFNSGQTMVEALCGTAHRLRNGNLKWKEDSYGG